MGGLMSAKREKATQLRLSFALILAGFFAGIVFPVPRFLLVEIG